VALRAVEEARRLAEHVAAGSARRPLAPGTVRPLVRHCSMYNRRSGSVFLCQYGHQCCGPYNNVYG
jgi:hypothetical protein